MINKTIIISVSDEEDSFSDIVKSIKPKLKVKNFFENFNSPDIMRNSSILYFKFEKVAKQGQTARQKEKFYR